MLLGDELAPFDAVSVVEHVSIIMDRRSGASRGVCTRRRARRRQAAALEASTAPSAHQGSAAFGPLSAQDEARPTLDGAPASSDGLLPAALETTGTPTCFAMSGQTLGQLAPTLVFASQASGTRSRA